MCHLIARQRARYHPTCANAPAIFPLNFHSFASLFGSARPRDRLAFILDTVRPIYPGVPSRLLNAAATNAMSSPRCRGVCARARVHIRPARQASCQVCSKASPFIPSAAKQNDGDRNNMKYDIDHTIRKRNETWNLGCANAWCRTMNCTHSGPTDLSAHTLTHCVMCKIMFGLLVISRIGKTITAYLGGGGEGNLISTLCSVQ